MVEKKSEPRDEPKEVGVDHPPAPAPERGGSNPPVPTAEAAEAGVQSLDVGTGGTEPAKRKG